MQSKVADIVITLPNDCGRRETGRNGTMRWPYWISEALGELDTASGGQRELGYELSCAAELACMRSTSLLWPGPPAVPTKCSPVNVS